MEIGPRIGRIRAENDVGRLLFELETTLASQAVRLECRGCIGCLMVELGRVNRFCRRNLEFLDAEAA